jgi:hypothetical protein
MHVGVYQAKPTVASRRSGPRLAYAILRGLMSQENIEIARRSITTSTGPVSRFGMSSTVRLRSTTATSRMPAALEAVGLSE